MSRGISSVEGLIRKVFKVSSLLDEVLFYRGHADKNSFKLIPSVYRENGWRENEHILFSELIAANPNDFLDDASTFEKLVRMQHHTLPTRLLDITSNPLMALYFACDGFPRVDGEVIFFKIKKNRIKFFDSDTVSCIANLARLSDHEKQSINTSLDQTVFNSTPPIPRMIHFIKEEKPYFTDCIVPSDLREILCVRTKMSNSRIISQSGAFLLFGLDSELHEKGTAVISIERVAIDSKEKEKIKEELSRLNINQSTVYPHIDNSAITIKTKYK